MYTGIIFSLRRNTALSYMRAKEDNIQCHPIYIIHNGNVFIENTPTYIYLHKVLVTYTYNTRTPFVPVDFDMCILKHTRAQILIYAN